MTMLRRTGRRVAGALLAGVLLAGHGAMAAPERTELAQLDSLRQGIDRLRERPAAITITNGVSFTVRFGGAVRGLEAGAPVEIHGLQVGVVRTVGLTYDGERNRFVVAVGIEIQPSLLPGPGDARPRNADETYAAMDALVRRGLRAGLATTQLLGGDMVVELDMRSGVAPDTLRRTGSSAEIPAAPSPAERLAERLPALLEKLGDAPVEQILADFQGSMAALKALVTGPELRGTLASLRQSGEDLNGFVKRLDARTDPVLAALTRTVDRAGATLGSIDRTLGERSPLVASFNNVLREAAGAARSLRLLVEYLERQPDALLRGKKEIRP